MAQQGRSGAVVALRGRDETDRPGNVNMKRVVVTGMGIVSPLGCGVEQVWSRLLDGHSGIVRLPTHIVDGIASQIGGMVPTPQSAGELGFDPDRVVDSKDQKKMDRFILFALEAARQALEQARWVPTNEEERAKTATVIASGIGGFSSLVDAVRIADARGPKRLSPFTIPSFLANMAAGQVSIRYGFTGPLGAPVTACAASVQAIGDAFRLIQTGEAEVALCGGAEASIDRVCIGAFAAARALSTGFSDTPEKGSRPFDQSRNGFVIGEGAGLLVIEELQHALRRGAQPIAELVGYGTSADAYHITSTPGSGEGACRAMRLALRQAGVGSESVQHINAHATSTPLGDRSELRAIKSVFGSRSSSAISATKSATGHLCGAAGGVEAIFTVLAIRDQIVPATLNLDFPDPESEGLDLVRGKARSLPIEYAISNGFGFGGVNASVLFCRWCE